MDVFITNIQNIYLIEWEKKKLEKYLNLSRGVQRNGQVNGSLGFAGEGIDGERPQAVD